jgi:hypothetical protein
MMTTAAPPSTAAHRSTGHGVLLADAMSLNAVTSATTGTALLVGAPWLDSLLGAAAWVLAALGLGLVLFAAGIVAALARPTRLRPVARLVVAADVGWMIAAGVLVVADVLTPLGDVLLAVVSVAVAGFAVSQTIGLRRAEGAGALGTRPVALRATREVAVAPAVAWAAVADAAGYGAFAPGIRRTTTDGDLADGMVRTCIDDGGRTWSETCTRVEPGHSYRMEVDTASYPLRYRLLFHEFGMTWQVTPTSAGSRIDLGFTGTVKLGVLGRLAMWTLRRDDPAEQIVDAYTQRLTAAA